MDANLTAFLDTIGASEGADYNTLFGGGTFSDYSTFPNVGATFVNNAGTTVTTHAAGKYQFEPATWNRLQAKLNLPDFSPPSQDAAAVELITEQGAYNDVINGDIPSAVSLLNTQWASFPGSNVSQGTKTIDQLQNYYTVFGGTLNAPAGNGAANLDSSILSLVNKITPMTVQGGAIAIIGIGAIFVLIILMIVKMRKK